MTTRMSAWKSANWNIWRASILAPWGFPHSARGWQIAMSTETGPGPRVPKQASTVVGRAGATCLKLRRTHVFDLTGSYNHRSTHHLRAHCASFQNKIRFHARFADEFIMMWWWRQNSVKWIEMMMIERQWAGLTRIDTVIINYHQMFKINIYY